MADPAGSCAVCDCVTGRVRPPGGVVWSDERFVLEGIQQIKDGMRIVPRDPDTAQTDTRRG